jgi:hypothetical protein
MWVQVQFIICIIPKLTSGPALLTAGQLPAMTTAVDQLASVLQPLYLGLEQELPAQAEAAHKISRDERYAWRKLLATLTVIERELPWY